MQHHNPYLAKGTAVSNLADIAARIVEGCKQKSPGNGLRGLRVALRKIDNGDGLVDPVEFKYGLRQFGIELTEEEAHSLLKEFDIARKGKLSLNELMHVIRQNSWSSAR